MWRKADEDAAREVRNCLGPRGAATRDCTGKSDFGGDHAEEVTDDSEGNVVRSRLSWGLLLLFFGR